ncbi:MAG: hypothetical protein HYZ27_02885 [Deltaproteobacteria bacterium]|nr:hypothetical protein [Deltaproteobacteria bacterium]
MPLPTQELQAGRVYRTRDLRQWTSNPTRLAAQLTREGRFWKLRGGLYYCPETSRFGPVPPDDEELLRAFLGDAFVVTGPPRWNSLGLGATALFALPLVYNRKRSGRIRFGSRDFQLRRVRFPEDPPDEWFAVDLLENHGMAGISLSELEAGLDRALRHGRLDGPRLSRMAGEYGTQRTRDLVERLLGAKAA